MKASRLLTGALTAVIAAGVLTAPVAAAAPPPEEPVAVAGAVETRIEAQGRTDYWVLLDERADLSGAAGTDDWAARGTLVVDRLRQTAARTQADLLADLTAKGVVAESFWAANAVLVRGGDAASLDVVREHGEVRAVYVAENVALPVPTTTDGTAADVEWGVAAVKAPRVWDSYGTRGEGVVVGSIDSGAQFDHPALVGSYRGNLGDGRFDHNHNWYDPANACGSPSVKPCDNTGHGTHTIGTIAGDGGPGNRIGVAPGVRWISAKGCETSSCSYVSLAAAMQWMLAPTDLNGQNPRPDLRPHVVSNSWGGAAVPVLHEILKAWVAAGVVPVFSAGNDYYCNVVGAPAVYPESIAVAAHDSAGRIAAFSSRGPAFDDYDRIKPDVAAPGVNVRSAWPGGGYEVANGTSMATPHVTGAIALALSAAPALTGDVEQVRQLVEGTARPVDDRSCDGQADDNNVYGHGLLDAEAMVAAAPRGAAATVTGTVSDETGAPVPGATVEVANGTFTRQTTTGADGGFQVPVLAGRVTVTAQSWGLRSIASTVDVQAGQSATVDAVLAAVPVHPVRGVVTRPDGTPAYGVDVVLTGTPLPPVRTGADGRFSWPAVPEASYRLSTGGARCVRHGTTRVDVDGTEDLTVPVGAVDDAWGTTCREEPAEWITADKPLPIGTGGGLHYDYEVPLPFTFRYYGDFVDSIRVYGEGRIGVRDPAHDGYGEISPFTTNALYFLEDSALRTKTVGTAPNRTFVVEWHNVQNSYYNSADGRDYQVRLSFEVLLGEDGSVTMQWDTDLGDEPDPLFGRRGGFAVGGVFHHQYNPHIVYLPMKPVLRSDTAVRFVPPAAGVLSGTVRDANDDGPVPAAVVTVRDGEEVLRRQQVRPDGRYHVEVPLGTHTVEVTAAHYRSQRTAVTATTSNQPLRLDPSLATGALTADRPDIALATVHGGRRDYRVTLRNPGSEPVDYRVDRAQAGDVGTSATNWPVELPGQLTGLAVDTSADTVWTVTRDGVLQEFTKQGAETGRQWDVTRVDEVDVRAGQVTYDGRGNLCLTLVRAVANVYSGDLRCVAADTGRVVSEIGGIFTSPDYLLPNEYTYSSALAYRADDDTFYVSDVNPLRRKVVRVAGASHAEPGRVLSSCELDESFASGLAWQPGTRELWAYVPGDYYGSDRVLRVEPDSCAILGHVENGSGLRFASMAIDRDGTLWGTDWRRVATLTTDLPAPADVPWLAVSGATSGTLAPGASATVTVSVDPAGLAEGAVRRAQLLVTSDAGRDHGLLRVPVTAVHPAYQVGVNAGGGRYTDSAGDRWQADRKYTGGDGYGWTGRSSVLTDRRLPDVMDRDARAGDLTYEFHGVPDGTYELELRFADSSRHGREPRVFDVVVDGRRVLDDYRPPTGSGETRTFPVTVTGGVARVQFLPTPGAAKPLVSALRLTQRPDLA